MCGLDDEAMNIKMEDDLGNKTSNFATPMLGVFIKVENESTAEDGTSSIETSLIKKEEDVDREEEATAAEVFVESATNSGPASFVETSLIKKEEETVPAQAFVESSETSSSLAAVVETSLIKKEDSDWEEPAVAEAFVETSYLNNDPASVVETLFIKTEENSDLEEEVSPQAFIESCAVDSGPVIETLLIKKEEDLDGEEEEAVDQSLVESDYRPFYGEQEYLRCDDNSFQTGVSDDGSDWRHDEDSCSVSFSAETHQESLGERQNYRAHGDSSGSDSQSMNATKAEVRMKRNLRKRRKTHFIFNYFPCVYCRGEFETEDDLKDHLKTHVSSPDHPKIHINAKLLPCTYCSGEFDTEDDLKEHLKSHSNFEGEKTGIKRKYNLRERPENLFIHKPFPCVYCQGEFETEDELKDHLKTHVSSTDHPKIHVNAKLLPCVYCSGEFRTEDDLKEHLKYHINLEEEKAAIRMKNNLRACLNSHLNNSSEFNIEGDLKDHLKTHVGSEGHLKIHIRAKRLPCAYCSGEFRTEDDLKNHLKTHATPKEPRKVLINADLLPCVYCLDEFETEDDLKEHLKTHVYKKRIRK